MKIAFCFISRPMCHAKFASDLANAMVATFSAGHEIALVDNVGTGIQMQRELAAEKAIEGGAEWLMWVDSDMRFPPDVALRLLKHRLPIVGCNYPTKELMPKPTARIYSETEKAWLMHHTGPASRGLERVSGLGFGAIMTQASVYAKLDKPWFAMPWSTINNKVLGEDLFFCSRAKEKGFETWLDHDLSRQIRHIGDFEYSLDHIDAMLEEVEERLAPVADKRVPA